MQCCTVVERMQCCTVVEWMQCCAVAEWMQCCAVVEWSGTPTTDASEGRRPERAPAHGVFLPVHVEAFPFGRASQFSIELFAKTAAGSLPPSQKGWFTCKPGNS